MIDNHIVEFPDLIEEVWDFKMHNEKLLFYIKWQNQPAESNTWEEYERIKDNHVFMDYIENLSKNYAVDIEINKENTRNKLKTQIKDIKAKQPGVCEDILKKKNFDHFKFKTIQLLWHFLMPQKELEEQLESFFVLNEAFTALKEQREKFHRLAVQMLSIDQYVAVRFENALDFKSPDTFKYIKRNKLSNALAQNSSSSSGCSCANNCVKSSRCCAVGGNLAYFVNSNNQIVLKYPDNEDQIITECGTECKCKKTCINRYTQQDSTVRSFKIFKSNVGWALKTESLIPKGGFITECCGVLFEKSTVNHKQQKSYFFHFKHDDKEFVIDAHESGNIGRFINHSCEPNAHVWKVKDQSNNLKSTRLVVLALRDISEYEEITVNYDKCSVGCLNNNLKCLCGSARCKGFIYSSKKLSSVGNVNEVLPPVPRVQPQLPQTGHPSIATTHRQGKNLDLFVNQATTSLTKKGKEIGSNIEEDKTPRGRLPKKYECTDCDYITTKEQSLRDHRLKMHDIGNVIICICGFIFLNNDHYKSHLNLVTKQESKFKEIVKKKKKELKLSDYKWIHNKHVKVPKPKNVEHVKAYLTHYTKHLQTSLKQLSEVQAKYFEK